MLQGKHVVLFIHYDNTLYQLSPHEILMFLWISKRTHGLKVDDPYAYAMGVEGLISYGVITSMLGQVDTVSLVDHGVKEARLTFKGRKLLYLEDWLKVTALAYIYSTIVGENVSNIVYYDLVSFYIHGKTFREVPLKAQWTELVEGKLSLKAKFRKAFIKLQDLLDEKTYPITDIDSGVNLSGAHPLRKIKERAKVKPKTSAEWAWRDWSTL